MQVCCGNKCMNCPTKFCMPSEIRRCYVGGLGMAGALVASNVFHFSVSDTCYETCSSVLGVMHGLCGTLPFRTVTPCHSASMASSTSAALHP